MSVKPMSLVMPCVVCGGVVRLVIAPPALSRYMCQRCKAVYFDDGVRDPSYPSLRDPRPASQEPDAFDRIHAAVVGQPRYSSGLGTQRARILFHNATTETSSNMAAYRVVRGGKVYDALVQYRRSAHRAWEWGKIKDHDASQQLWGVQNALGKILWFTDSQLRSPMQPLPPPVAVPPSLKRAARTSKRLAKPVIAQPTQYWVWTERLTVGTSGLSRRKENVRTDLGGMDLSRPLELGSGVSGIMHYSNLAKAYYLFEQTTGSALGVMKIDRIGAVEAQRQLLATARAAFEHRHLSELRRALVVAGDCCRTAKVISYTDFFGVDTY